MIDFHRCVLAMPKFWAAWLGLLALLNGLGGLVFISSPEGLWTLVIFLASAMLMMGLFRAFGFVRLLGMGHILWVPLVFWLASRLGAAPETGWLRLWMTAVIVVNATSLVIDVIDVIRYLRGDRAPTVTLG